MNFDQAADWLDNEFAARSVMAIIRAQGMTRSVDLAQGAWDAGIELVEVTVQSRSDLAALEAVAAAGARRKKSVGAGTIVAVDQVGHAREAGASYLVCPGTDRAVIDAAQDLNVPIVPGVATATEVQLALSLNLTWLKAFPAIALGEGWFRSMSGPFPDAKFIATGGIDLSNASNFFESGALIVGIGSAIADAKAVLAVGATGRSG